MNNLVKNKKYIARNSIFFLCCFFVLAGVCWANSKKGTNYLFQKAEIRSDGTLLINKKPFFPFGLYHVSWDVSPDKRLKDLQEISKAGFNVIHASAPDWNNYENFLDKASQLGIYVISEQNSGSILDFVDRFKKKPAVLGWKIADDVDIYKDGILDSPSEIVDLHQKVKRADPNHITYIAGAIDKRIANYVNTADSIGATAYPIGHEENQPIGWAYHMVSIINRAALKKHLVTAALQAFRWPAKNATIPTTAEVQNLTYQSIVAGAKGIIYYTYYDETWDLDQHPDLWKGLKSLVPEIKRIDSFLLNGENEEIATNTEKVKSKVWFLNGQALVMLVNMSYSKSDNISIKIPRKIKEEYQILKNNSVGLEINGNKISMSMKPLGVSVFRFSLKNE